MTHAHGNNRLRRTLPAILLLGDTLVAFGALLLGYWVRYHTSLGHMFVEVHDARLGDYLPLLSLGCGFLIATFLHNGLYDDRLLLRHYQSVSIILKGIMFWFIAYLGVSLVLRFTPPISRIFVVYACVAAAVMLYLWRHLFYHALVATRALTEPLRQRTVILGWSSEAGELARALLKHRNHPYALAGHIDIPGHDGATPGPEEKVCTLGNLRDLEALLLTHRIDVLITARLDLPRADLAKIVTTCERHGTELKIIPSVFQVFVTGLRLQTIGAVPVLGVEELALGRWLNRALKRSVDIVGSLAGLVIFAPVMGLLALLIKRESPHAAVIFSQRRLGQNNREFTMYKLRSMRPGAELSDHKNVSTPAGDERVLAVGAWMRRWNLDELPQLWNVLKGEMSLVGPRPERTHHAENLAESIPHYMPRHLAKPGMTGWAQVNGLRGNCSLELRIQHDLHYIENWSPWMDLQIVMLTFVRWRNRSE